MKLRARTAIFRLVLPLIVLCAQSRGDQGIGDAHTAETPMHRSAMELLSKTTKDGNAYAQTKMLLDWMRKLDPPSPQLPSVEADFEQLKDTVETDLIELWFLTGHGGPVLKFSHRDLAAHALDVCKDYTAWLESMKDLDDERLCKACIRENIDSLNSEYCWLVLNVLQHELSFVGRPVVTDVGYLVTLSSESRKSASEAMTKWYRERSQGNELYWDAKSGKFTAQGGVAFKFPKFKLEIGADE